jgi:hypothetical protein
MAERVDKKLQTVVLARYRYRHEAEFAAGFLDEAGIPYRLQIDDPAMGMTIGTPATLWVRGMDVRAALDTLNVRELPSHRAAAEAAEAVEGEGGWEGSEPAGAARTPGAERRSGAASSAEAAKVAEAGKTREATETAHAAGITSATGYGRSTLRHRSAGDRLTTLERTVAIGIFVVLGGTAYLASAGAVWGAVLAALAAPLGLVGLLGRAPSAIRRLLRAISGSAP